VAAGGCGRGFLVAYAVPILNPDLPSWLPELCRSLSWVTWGLFIIDCVSGCSWPMSGCATWSGTGTTVIVLPLARPLRLLG